MTAVCRPSAIVDSCGLTTIPVTNQQLARINPAITPRTTWDATMDALGEQHQNNWDGGILHASHHNTHGVGLPYHADLTHQHMLHLQLSGQLRL
jgi:hypothetical protein